MDVATPAGALAAQQLLSGPQPLATAAGGDVVLAAALRGGALLLNNMHQVRGTSYSGVGCRA
jgi:hypothetical protein